MKYLQFLFLAILVFSCKRQTANESSLTISDSTRIKNQTEVFFSSDSFKYKQLHEFSLVGWYYGKREKELKKLSVDDVKKFFQGRETEKNPLENNYYFFSYQGFKGGFELVTLIDEHEQCFADLCLMVYDKNHKLLNKNVIGGTGGDGNYSYNSWGYFIGDSIYNLTYVGEDVVSETDDYSEYEIDSVIIKYSVGPDYSFKEFDKREFKRKRIEK